MLVSGPFGQYAAPCRRSVFNHQRKAAGAREPTWMRFSSSCAAVNRPVHGAKLLHPGIVRRIRPRDPYGLGGGIVEWPDRRPRSLVDPHGEVHPPPVLVAGLAEVQAGPEWRVLLQMPGASIPAPAPTRRPAAPSSGRCRPSFHLGSAPDVGTFTEQTSRQWQEHCAVCCLP